MPTFEQIVDEALQIPFEGWDFSAVQHRVRVEPQPWDYAQRVNELAVTARSLVDLGTGGGEFLASVTPRPPRTVATEAWGPNVAVARRTLHPCGIHVVHVEGARDNADQGRSETRGALPFADETFDLVIDRHEAFVPSEVARILRPHGRFITQQVGDRNEVELFSALGFEPQRTEPALDLYLRQLPEAGLLTEASREALPRKRYLDVGVIAFNLKNIPYGTDPIDVHDHLEALRAIHDVIVTTGGFTVRQHRVLFEATKP